MRRTLPILALVLLATATGCEDTVIDPFDNPGRYFSVWGWIDPGATRQKIRVVPVTRWSPVVQSEDDLNATIDARVFSTDLNTGARIEWDHQLVRLADGSLAHVYRGALDVRPATRFRLEIQRSDGRTTHVETRVPSLSLVGGAVAGEPYVGEGGHVLQDITLQGIANPWDIRVTYLAEGAQKKRSVWVEYDRSGGPTGSGDWIFTVDLTADQELVQADIEEGLARGEIPPVDEFGNRHLFGLTQMGVRLTVLDEAWPIPADSVDVEQFARPDAVSNVVNGYGFWGAAAPYVLQWGVPSELSVRLGWDF